MAEAEVECPTIIPHLVAAGMLFLALARWPYGYYSLLRWVVCGAAVYGGWLAYEGQRKWLLGLFIPVGLLFNPLVPIHLTRQGWAPIDFIVGTLFLVSALIQRKTKPN